MRNACLAGVAVFGARHARSGCRWLRSPPPTSLLSGSRQTAQVTLQRAEPDSQVPSSPQGPSEEELLELELADMDLDFDDSEIQEWEQFDKQVAEYQSFVDMGLVDEPGAGPRNGADFGSSQPTEEDIEHMMNLLVKESGIEDLDQPGHKELEQLEAMADFFGAPSEPTPSVSSSATVTATATATATAALAETPSVALGEPPAGFTELGDEDKENANPVGEITVTTDPTKKQTVVLVSQEEDELQYLPQLLPEAFRQENVRMLKGWMEWTDNGTSTSAYEVVDAETLQPLSEDRAMRLETRIAGQLQVGLARNILSEMRQDKVPRLEGYFVFPRPDLVDEVLYSLLIIGAVRFIMTYVMNGTPDV